MRFRFPSWQTLSQKRQLIGYLFISPFIVGFFLLVLYPIIQSVRFSLSELEILQEGYRLHYIGLENYRYALVVDPDFFRSFVNTVVGLVRDLPLILVFSLGSALVLNQRFKGRVFFRVVFFLPVILGAGVVLRIERGDYMTTLFQISSGDVGFFTGAAMSDLLMQMKLPMGFMNYILAGVNRIPEIIKMSGVQILIFLAGLQSIPRSVYEAAEVEGSTTWESFWMITLPMISPLLLTATIYTIIDSFTAPSNQLMELVSLTAKRSGGFGLSVAMAWLYFASVILIVTLVNLVLSKWIFYNE